MLVELKGKDEDVSRRLRGRNWVLAVEVKIPLSMGGVLGVQSWGGNSVLIKLRVVQGTPASSSSRWESHVGSTRDGQGCGLSR